MYSLLLFSLLKFFIQNLKQFQNDVVPEFLKILENHLESFIIILFAVMNFSLSLYNVTLKTYQKMLRIQKVKQLSNNPYKLSKNHYVISKINTYYFNLLYDLS